ncbi:HPF/RaiA family ribosome-associated protein, partial [Flavobacteriaceae bacterium]|nr:HPF/RaiA family ribosome-associated protein [Flavobacteriaceae bacterium]
MKINTQTVNFNADATLIDFLDNRVQKLEMFFDHIIDVDVFLKVEN